MRSMRLACLFLAVGALVLSGCSGNGGGGSTAPTALSYSAAAPVFVRGVAIAPDNPACSGAVTSWTVSPALPAGLTLNAGTGILSGTPTAVAVTATYTVTAAGAGGSTTTTLSITVNDQAPAKFSYAAGTVTYTVGEPITPNGPSNSGAAVISYGMSPTLPSGLSFSTTTGVITGDPTAVSPATSYAVTATNSGGTAAATVTITVNPAASAPLASPAGLAYNPGDAIYTVGVPIPENYPTSTGGPPLTYYNSAGTEVYAYTVSPPLPPGLYLSGTSATLGDNGTGVISGIPQQAVAKTTYTITASNLAGGTTAPLTLTVNPADQSPSGLAYSFPAPVYVAGLPITPDVPVTNSTIGSSGTYSINPPLPTGLSFDPGSGTIEVTVVPQYPPRLSLPLTHPPLALLSHPLRPIQ